MPTYSGILAWRVPEERSLAGYSPRILYELDMTEQLNMRDTHTHTHTHTHKCFEVHKTLAQGTQARCTCSPAPW